MEEPERFFYEELEKRVTLKQKQIGYPDHHLKSKVSQVTLENGVKFQSFSSSQCVQAATKNVEECRYRADIGPLSKAKSPWPSNYHPDADDTPELILLKNPFINP